MKMENRKISAEDHGRKGGNKVLDKYGSEHFRRMAIKSAESKRKKKLTINN